MKRNKEKIAVIGLGYVGLPLALLAKRNGYDVIGVDRDLRVIKNINNHICPYGEINITKALKKNPINVSKNIKKIAEAKIVIVCVPTPINKNHKPDLKPVISSSKSIGKYLAKDQLIILESTVNPGVIRKIVVPVLEKESGLKAGVDFYVAHCPERINPGSKRWNVGNLPRVVGSLEKVGLTRAVKFYKSIVKAKIKAMHSIEEAEAVKILENCFRDVNIAFINEFARSFDKLGIDILHVVEGAAGKPFSFLPHYPGCGVGGHCIPVDPYYMIEHAKNNGFNHNLLKLARQINNDMPKYTVDRTLDELKRNNIKINNAKVALLGLSYKKNLADIRESPSFEIMRLLTKLGINVRTYDPYVIKKSLFKSLKKAIEGVDAIIIATDHDEFLTITPKMMIDNSIRILIDGRNAFNKKKFIQAGIHYKGIGR